METPIIERWDTLSVKFGAGASSKAMKEEALDIAQQLREAGINTDIDLMSRGISKNLNYAHAMAIPQVLFVGERELKEGKVKLRDMVTGKEEMLDLKAAIKSITT